MTAVERGRIAAFITCQGRARSRAGSTGRTHTMAYGHACSSLDRHHVEYLMPSSGCAVILTLVPARSAGWCIQRAFGREHGIPWASRIRLGRMDNHGHYHYQAFASTIALKWERWPAGVSPIPLAWRWASTRSKPCATQAHGRWAGQALTVSMRHGLSGIDQNAELVGSGWPTQGMSLLAVLICSTIHRAGLVPRNAHLEATQLLLHETGTQGGAQAEFQAAQPRRKAS